MSKANTPRSGVPRPGLPRPGRGGGSGRPQRVRVTSPRMGTVSRPPARSPSLEIVEQTRLGEVYMRSLIRSQLRLAGTALAVMVLVLAALPLLFAWQPALSAVRVVGVPLPWLLIGVLVYPALTGGAAWLARAADRAERDFGDIVERR